MISNNTLRDELKKLAIDYEKGFETMSGLETEFGALIQRGFNDYLFMLDDDLEKFDKYLKALCDIFNEIFVDKIKPVEYEMIANRPDRSVKIICQFNDKVIEVVYR